MYEARRLHVMHTVYMSTSGVEMVNFPSHKLKLSWPMLGYTHWGFVNDSEPYKWAFIVLNRARTNLYNIVHNGLYILHLVTY